MAWQLASVAQNNLRGEREAKCGMAACLLLGSRSRDGELYSARRKRRASISLLGATVGTDGMGISPKRAEGEASKPGLQPAHT